MGQLEDLNIGIARATSLAKFKLLPWSLIDLIPLGGIIPKDTGVMSKTNHWNIHNSGHRGELDLVIWFSTPYAQFVEDNPSRTGSQHFMSRVDPKVKQIIGDAIISALSQQNIEVLNIQW